MMLFARFGLNKQISSTENKKKTKMMTTATNKGHNLIKVINATCSGQKEKKYRVGYLKTVAILNDLYVLFNIDYN